MKTCPVPPRLSSPLRWLALLALLLPAACSETVRSADAAGSPVDGAATDLVADSLANDASATGDGTIDLPGSDAASKQDATAADHGSPAADAAPDQGTALDAAPGGLKLTWSPSAAGVAGYKSYPVKQIVAGTRTYKGGGGDLWLKLPQNQRWEAPASGGLVIADAHNVVLIGGEIYLPGSIPNSETPRRAVYIVNITGSVFIEGLLVHGPGCADTFTINAPQAKVYLQNIRAEISSAYDTSTPHADLIQPWGGHAGLYLDRFSGLTTYQGLQIQEDLGPVGPVYLRRVSVGHNPNGKSAARYLMWLDDQMDPVYIDGDTFWAQKDPSRTSPYLWPHATTSHTDALGDYLTYPTLQNPAGEKVVQNWDGSGLGKIRAGLPSGGHYVSQSDVGLGYVSPGYLP